MDKVKKSAQMKKLKKWATKSQKDLTGWTKKKYGAIKGMSNKRKMAIAGAAVGLPALAGGLSAYSKYRRKKREAK